MSSHIPVVRTRLGGMLAAAVLCTACSDTTGLITSRFEGTYALQSVNGNPVPALAAQGGGQRYFLLADTLAFSRDGTVARSRTVRHIDDTSAPARETVYSDRSVFPYAVDDGRLTIGSRAPCPPNANCIGFEEGTISETHAVVIGRLYWSGDPVLTYRRVPSR